MSFDLNFDEEFWENTDAEEIIVDQREATWNEDVSYVTDIEMMDALIAHETNDVAETIETNDEVLLEGLKSYIDKGRNPTTERKIRQSGTRFLNYLAEKGIDTSNISAIQKTTINVQLGNYLCEFKNLTTGADVEPDTLSSAVRMINKYLQRQGCDYDILKDREFEIARATLNTRRNELTSLGKGNKPKKADALSLADEDNLFASGQMGLHSPKALMNMLWYGFVKGFGMRGSHECSQLMWDDVRLVEEEGRRSFLEWNERLTKTRTGTGRHHRAYVPKIFRNDVNSARCIVQAFELYSSKRPRITLTSEWKFFLQVNNKAKLESPTWFKAQHLGTHSLNSLMKTMAKNVGMVGRYTNHSARSSSINQLIHAGVAPQLVAQVSGHKDVSSVMHYAVANRDQQQAMSDILQGNLSSLPPRPRVPSAALGRAPSPDPGTDESFTVTETRSQEVTSTGATVSSVTCQAVRRTQCEENLRGMFAGATINGNVIVNLKQ